MIITRRAKDNEAYAINDTMKEIVERSRIRFRRIVI